MLPDFLRSQLRALRALIYQGERFFCPLCEKRFRTFFSYGDPLRAHAQCPYCRSVERHRLLWLVLQRQWRSGELASHGRLLHVAPEFILEKKFSAQYDYLSVDLDGKKAMRAMDVTRLGLEDGSFDAVVCNHVLEHVLDDRKALAEFFRVLKPGGWGLIQVPMDGEMTHEDPSVTDPAERERLFGQYDHVRQYGRDFVARLEEAGFTVRVFHKQELVAGEELERLSIACEDEVILSQKPLEFGR